jgi:aspartyl/asparaginyl beta-hydroxylase (cupin superfamily)
VILVVGVLREETPWEILALAVWVSVYVEMVMRKQNELGGLPW